MSASDEYDGELLVSLFVFPKFYPPNCSFFLRQFRNHCNCYSPCILMCIPVAEEKTLWDYTVRMGGGSCFGDGRVFRGRSRVAQWYNGGRGGGRRALWLLTLVRWWWGWLCSSISCCWCSALIHWIVSIIRHVIRNNEIPILVIGKSTGGTIVLQSR